MLELCLTALQQLAASSPSQTDVGKCALVIRHFKVDLLLPAYRQSTLTKIEWLFSIFDFKC